jgi:signal transduction histidine kinase
VVPTAIDHCFGAPGPLADAALLDLLPVAVCFCDVQGAPVRWNRRAVDLWGRQPRPGDAAEAFAGAHRFRAPDGSPLAPGQGPVADSLRTGEPRRNRELLLERPDGSRCTVLVDVDLLRDEAGRVEGAVCVLQDVSARCDFLERKRTEESLAERTRLAALRADISEALALDEAARPVLQRCAEAIVRHLGVAFARVWTLNEAENVLHLQASAGLYTHIDGPHGRVPVGQFKIGRIAQTRRPHLTNDVPQDPHVSNQEWARREGMVAFAGYPLLIEDRSVGVLAMFARHPLSDSFLRELEPIAAGLAQYIRRRQSEEALRRAKEELEDRVRERTAELAATNEALRRSNRELEQFAWVASHDLQEPLRKIQAFGDRLASRCAAALDAQGRDYLARMQSAAQRMSTLINDLLAFSRVTSKAQPFAPVDLGRMARDVLSDLESRLQETAGRVEVGSLPTIDADPLQTRQLLQNLLGNALKFHKPDQPPVVAIRSEVMEEEGRPVCRLAVEDNGIGFDEKYLDRIFDVFERLHPRTQYEGTGMGLAICRKIVERHGGTITARSRPGEGATFLVTLPVSQPQAE